MQRNNGVGGGVGVDSQRETFSILAHFCLCTISNFGEFKRKVAEIYCDISGFEEEK